MNGWLVAFMKRIQQISTVPGRYIILFSVRDDEVMDWTITRLGKIERTS
jgi:hypothetical protein